MIEKETLLFASVYGIEGEYDGVLEIEEISDIKKWILDTGFEELDNVLQGIESGSLVEVVGGQKLCSMLTNNIIINGNRDGVTTVIFSHSRDDKSVGLEMLSSVGRINKNLLDTGDLRKVNDLDCFNACNKINSSNLRVSTNCPSSLEEMYDEIFSLKYILGVDMFIIDNFTSIFANQFEQSFDKGQADIYNGLKALAKDLNIVVIILTEESNKTVDFSSPDGPCVVDRISDLQINIAELGDNDLIKFTVYDQEKELVEFTRKWMPKYCCFDPITEIDELK